MLNLHPYNQQLSVFVSIANNSLKFLNPLTTLWFLIQKNYVPIKILLNLQRN